MAICACRTMAVFPHETAASRYEYLGLRLAFVDGDIGDRCCSEMGENSISGSTDGAPRRPLPAKGTRHTRFVLTLPVAHPPKENDVDPLAGQPRAQRANPQIVVCRNGMPGTLLN